MSCWRSDALHLVAVGDARVASIHGQAFVRAGLVAPRFTSEVPRELLVRPGQIRASAEESTFLLPAAMKDRYRELGSIPVQI